MLLGNWRWRVTMVRIALNDTAQMGCLRGTIRMATKDRTERLLMVVNRVIAFTFGTRMANVSVLLRSEKNALARINKVMFKSNATQRSYGCFLWETRASPGFLSG